MNNEYFATKWWVDRETKSKILQCENRIRNIDRLIAEKNNIHDDKYRSHEVARLTRQKEFEQARLDRYRRNGHPF